MRRTFITVALIAIALLSGCGSNQETTEVIAPVESQVSQQEDTGWYQDKVFQEVDTGFYFWVENIDNKLCFVTNYEYTTEYSGTEHCIAIIPDNEYTVKSDDDGKYLQYLYQNNDGEVVTIIYIPDTEQVNLLIEEPNGQYSMLSGVYNRVTQTTEPIQEQSTEEPYEFGEYNTLGTYQCFDTDTKVGAELQDGYLVLYFEPNADTYILERNGADTGWEFTNWEFEDRVYTSVIIQDNEMIISSTEPWRFDGTYIQLPDIGTDGEGE